MSEKQTPVDAYLPAENGTEAILSYPYARPEGSFYTDGHEVTELPDRLEDFREAADGMLRSKGLPLLAERIPVVAYGANVSPAKFKDKMTKYGSGTVQSELQNVPMLTVEVPDSQVVWHGKPSQAGGVFSELYQGPETKGQSAHAALQFLTEEQLAIIHASEGVTYHFAPVDVLSRDGVTIHAIAYVAGKSSMLVKDGKPVAMKVDSHDDVDGMTARQAVSYMLKHAGSILGIETPEELIALNTGKKLIEKKANQAAVEQPLQDQGLSKVFSHPAQDEWFYGRADFNGLNRVGHNPSVLHLAEESLARLRPTKAEVDELAAQIADSTGVSLDVAHQKALAKLDIMPVIRGRRRAELQERIDNAIDKQ